MVVHNILSAVQNSRMSKESEGTTEEVGNHLCPASSLVYAFNLKEGEWRLPQNPIRAITQAKLGLETLFSSSMR